MYWSPHGKKPRRTRNSQRSEHDLPRGPLQFGDSPSLERLLGESPFGGGHHRNWSERVFTPNRDRIRSYTQRLHQEVSESPAARNQWAEDLRAQIAMEEDSRRRDALPRSELPVVRGPEDANAASELGDPYVIKGVARLPKSEMPKALDYKNHDTLINKSFNGEWGEPFDYLNLITQQVGNTFRTGKQITIKAVEFRLYIRNPTQSYENQAPYSWAGTPGTAQTTRTVPPITVFQNYYESEFLDAARATYPQFFNGMGAAPGGVHSVLAAGAPQIPPIAPIFPPFAGSTAEFNFLRGPLNDVELQPQQVGVVDAQGFPALPSWTSPTHITRTGVLAGMMCPCRVMLLYDRYGHDAGYSSGTDPTWNDILDNPASPGAICSPVYGLYKMAALDRFLILADTVWEPNRTDCELSVIFPPKMVDLTTTYGDSPLFPVSGTLILGVASSTYFTPLSIQPYVCYGNARVVYSDD